MAMARHMAMARLTATAMQARMGTAVMARIVRLATMAWVRAITAPTIIPVEIGATTGGIIEITAGTDCPNQPFRYRGRKLRSRAARL